MVENETPEGQTVPKKNKANKSIILRFDCMFSIFCVLIQILFTKNNNITYIFLLDNIFNTLP